MREKISFWMTALLISAALSAISPKSWGQATSGILSGVVQDQSQAVIVGATVTATNTETGVTRTAVTNSAGRYRVGELMPGTYQLTVSMDGFRRELQEASAQRRAELERQLEAMRNPHREIPLERN